MITTDQDDWNERYRSGEFGYRDPDAFVMDAHHNYLEPLLMAGSAGLDLAGGAGHHAIWLAQQGWRMTLVDFSQAAIAIARERSEGTRLEMLCGPAHYVVESLIEQKQQFGFVLVSFFLEREVLSMLPSLLAPDGLLLYRSYTVDNVRLKNPNGPRNPLYLLQSQELLKAYSKMRILHYNETVAVKGVVELIAQRD